MTNLHFYWNIYSANVTVTTTKSYPVYVSGFLGYGCPSTFYKVDFQNNGNEGAVFITSNSTSEKDIFGGFIGYLYSTTINEIYFHNNNNNGIILANLTGSSDSYVGGFAGYFYCSGSNSIVQFSNNTNSGFLNVESNTGMWCLVSGMVASMFFSSNSVIRFNNNTNEGNILFSSRSSYRYYIGFFIGYLNPTSVSYSVAFIENVNSGTVEIETKDGEYFLINKLCLQKIF